MAGLDLAVLPDLQDCREHVDYLELKDWLARLAPLALRDLPALLDQKGPLVGLQQLSTESFIHHII